MTPRDEPVREAGSRSSGSTGPIRLEAIVRGRVQGVGFRYFVLRQADRLELRGWVANDSDGAVHVVAEGPRGDLDQLADRLSIGPAGAGVVDVELRWGAASGGYDRFSVRAGGHSGD